MDNRLVKTYGDENSVYDINHLPAILSWVKPNSRVLEFGPAMGYMTRFMKESLNCRVTAIEISPEMAKNAGKYTEKIIVANLDTDNWANGLEGTFDFIIFADVLEHLRDPQSILQTAVSFLSKEGCVLTSIPNIAHASIILSLIDGEFDYQKYGLLDNTHVHFFTRKSIKTMIDICGLECIHEKNIIITPGATEFHKFFITHPLAAFSLLGKRDILVYQFVDKWCFAKENNNIITSASKPVFFRAILALLDDLNEFCFYKLNLRFSLPKFLKKIVRNE